jgi:hypothetical protein
MYWCRMKQMVAAYALNAMTGVQLPRMLAVEIW